MANKPTEFPLTHTVALVGHRSAGKTTLAESVMLLGGVIRSAGTVQNATTLLDHDAASRRRGASLQPSFAWVPWRDRAVQVVDTPGSLELEHIRNDILSGVDAAVVVVDAGAGVELGTRRALNECSRLGLPVVIAVNKCDRHVVPQDVLAQLSDCVAGVALPVTLPVPSVAGAGLEGVVDLQQMRMWRYLDDGSGRHSVEPLASPGRWEASHDRLTETVALSDDALLDHYLEYLDLPGDALVEGLANAVRRRSVTPVVFCSATQVVGIQHVIDAIRDTIPASDQALTTLVSSDGEEVVATVDGPFVAQVLATALDEQGQPYAICRVRSGAASRKTTWTPFGESRGRRVNKLYHLRGRRRKVAQGAPMGSIVATWDLPGVTAGDVLSDKGMWLVQTAVVPSREECVWLVPQTPSDERRLDAALVTLLQSDGTLEVRLDVVTDGIVLAGLSQLQLTLAAERLATLGVHVTSRDVPIGYREVPAATVRGVHGTHQRTDSDDDIVEYGHVVIDLVPTSPDTQLRFVAACDPNDLPASYHAAVQEGVLRALQAGPLAGYPVMGAQVVLTGGGYNAIFTTVEHVVLAAEKAARSALERTRTALVEPWIAVELTVSSEHVGACLATTGAHRGRVSGVESGAESTVIMVVVPQREWRRMRGQLSSVTAGTASVKTDFDHYEDVSCADARTVVGGGGVSPRRTRQLASSSAAPCWRAHARTR